jgi:hypothetical protein
MTQFLPYLLAIVTPVHKQTYEEFSQPLRNFLALPTREARNTTLIQKTPLKNKFLVPPNPEALQRDKRRVVLEGGQLRARVGQHTPNHISRDSFEVQSYLEGKRVEAAAHVGAGGAMQQGGRPVSHSWRQGLSEDVLAAIDEEMLVHIQNARLMNKVPNSHGRDQQARRTLSSLFGARVPATHTPMDASPLYVALIGLLDAMRVSETGSAPRRMYLTSQEKQEVAALIVHACNNPSAMEQLENTCLRNVAAKIERTYEPRVMHELRLGGLFL